MCCVCMFLSLFECVMVIHCVTCPFCFVLCSAFYYQPCSVPYSRSRDPLVTPEHGSGHKFLNGSDRGVIYDKGIFEFSRCL